MKKVSFLFKVLMTLLAFALPLSCDSGGGGSGGGGSSAKNSDSGTTSVTITIPKAASSSSDINLLGDFTPTYATANFHYGIYFKNDARTSETQYATAGGSVTFDNVEYDTYDFCLDIYVDSHKKTKLDTIKVNKTISASENTVQFPNMSVSSYKQWFFVATTVDFLDAITKIKNDTATYTAEEKAIICLRDSIACPGFQSKLNEIEERYTLYTNNYEIADVLYTVSIAGGITGGAVSADPTSASVGRVITLAIQPEEEKELDTLSVSGVTEINYNDARTEATFAMPASNVTVTATFKTKKYAVTIAGSGAGGTVELSGTTAREFEKGQGIVLAITKNSGYRLNSLKVGDDEKVSEIADDTLSFTMPNKNIVITAEFVQLYSITLPTGITAKIGEDEVTEAAENDSVTITITPASGYALETLKQGSTDVTERVSDNEYEFSMDGESVEFSATWKAEESDTCDIGSVVLTSGKFVKKDNIGNLSDAQKAAAIAVIFHVSGGTLGSYNLGVGLVTQQKKWRTAASTIDPPDFSSYVKTYIPSLPGGGTPSTSRYFTYTTTLSNGSAGPICYYHAERSDGFDGSVIFANKVSSTYSYSSSESSYPAFYFARHYKDFETKIADTSCESGWYIPSVGELFQLKTTFSLINASLSALEISDISTDKYFWSCMPYINSNVSSGQKNYVKAFKLSASYDEGIAMTASGIYALAVRQF